MLNSLKSRISAPYNAAIIAYERMSAFAILSIIEAILKLAVAFAINYFTGQRLILYAALLLSTTIIMRFAYSSYCSHVFKEIKYKFFINIGLIKKMLSFSGWMIFGCLADLLGTQGVNMMINVFFGPIFNAARAIAVQVQGAVAHFSNNFIISVNPQIIKSYAAGDKVGAYRLVFSASKFSFFLMLLIILPVTMRTQEILKLWLGIIPEYTAIFVNLILLEYLIRSSYTPIAQINQASGNIRLYQISISLLYIVNFAGSYILFKTGWPVYSTFIFSSIIAIIGLFIRLGILYKQLRFPALKYLKTVSLRIFIVAVISFSVGFAINNSFSDSISGLIYACLAISMFNLLVMWSLGLDKFEREFIKSKTLAIINKGKLKI